MSPRTSEAHGTQLVPPNLHRTNAEEKAIGIFKDHFISGLATVHPSFPIYAVATVVIWGHAQIPAVHSMYVPCASIVRGLMHYYLAAGRRNRDFVVVKNSIEYFIR